MTGRHSRPNSHPDCTQQKGTNAACFFPPTWSFTRRSKVSSDREKTRVDTQRNRQHIPSLGQKKAPYTSPSHRHDGPFTEHSAHFSYVRHYVSRHHDSYTLTLPIPPYGGGRQWHNIVHRIHDLKLTRAGSGTRRLIMKTQS